MSTLDQIKTLIDDYWNEDELINTMKVLLDQAKNAKPDCQCIAHIDLTSSFGQFLCKLLNRELEQYDTRNREEIVLSNIRFALNQNKRNSSSITTKSIHDIFEEQLNRFDLTPFLRYAMKNISNRLDSIIRFLNTFYCDKINLPHDETAFGKYLLYHYYITINFIDLEAYIDQNCIDDIQKKGYK